MGVVTEKSNGYKGGEGRVVGGAEKKVHG